jgi:hypothetical protein
MRAVGMPMRKIEAARPLFNVAREKWRGGYWR